MDMDKQKKMLKEVEYNKRENGEGDWGGEGGNPRRKLETLSFLSVLY